MSELFIGEIDYEVLVRGLEKSGRVYIDLCCGNGTLFPTYLCLHQAQPNGFCLPVADLSAAVLPGHGPLDPILVMAIQGWGCYTFALERFGLVTDHNYVATHLHRAQNLPASDALALSYFLSRTYAAWRGVLANGDADWRAYFGSPEVRRLWRGTFDQIPTDLACLWLEIEYEENHE